MTETEKLAERLEAIEQAISAVHHATSVDRKMSHDKHMNGHFTKALTELDSVKKHVNSLITRLERTQ